MKILLVYPPILRSADIYSTALPIGMLQVGAYLLDCGHEVRALNLELGGTLRTVSIDELRRAYADTDVLAHVNDPNAAYRREFRSVLAAFRPDIVGFSVATEQVDAARCLADDARRVEPHVQIEFGGLEQVRTEWVAQVSAAALEYDPAIDLLTDQNPPESFGSILTSHGCPHACTFCSSPQIYGRKITHYAPDRLRRRLEDAARLGAGRIHLVDDTITITKRRAVEVADLMGAFGLPWRTQSRADDLVRNASLIGYFKERGCTQLTMGIESGSPRILERMQKRITREDALRAADLLDGAGMAYTANFMIGYPGETDEDVAQTIALIEQMQPKRVLAGSVVPYPASEVHTANPEFVDAAGRWPLCRWSPFDPGFLRDEAGNRIMGPSRSAIDAFYDVVRRVNDHAPTPGTFSTILSAK